MSEQPSPPAQDESDPTPGRLIVIAGADGTDPAAVARTVAAERERGVAIDGSVVAGCVVAGAAMAPGANGAGVGVAASAGLAAIQDAMLRYVAMLSLADVYTRAGYDVFVSEVMDTDRLDDLLDLADPQPVEVVRLQVGADESLLGPGHSVDGRGDTTVVVERVAGILPAL